MSWCPCINSDANNPSRVAPFDANVKGNGNGKAENKEIDKKQNEKISNSQTKPLNNESEHQHLLNNGEPKQEEGIKIVNTKNTSEQATYVKNSLVNTQIRQDNANQQGGVVNDQNQDPQQMKTQATGLNEYKLNMLSSINSQPQTKQIGSNNQKIDQFIQVADSISSSKSTVEVEAIIPFIFTAFLEKKISNEIGKSITFKGINIIIKKFEGKELSFDFIRDLNRKVTFYTLASNDPQEMQNFIQKHGSGKASFGLCQNQTVHYHKKRHFD